MDDIRRTIDGVSRGTHLASHAAHHARFAARHVPHASRATHVALNTFLACALVLCLVPLLPATARAGETKTGGGTTVPELLAGCADSLAGAVGAEDVSGAYAGDRMDAGNSVCDWFAYDLSRLSVADRDHAYLDKLETYVTESYADADVLLDRNKSTEWNRISIVVNALGGDPTSFGTDANGDAIDLVKDGCYDWQQTSSIGIQGSNGWDLAIEMLDATGQEVPSDALYTKESMISELLAMQADDGGFGLSAGSSSVDLTAMAVTALAPHRSEAGVEEAIDRAVAYLSEAQGANGRFTADGVESSESSSMVVLALCSLQMDPRTSEGFVKDGVSAYDGLLSYRRDDGSFSHADDDDTSSVELMATEQAMRALIAVDELDNGGDGDFYTADVTLNLPGDMATDPSRNPLPWVIGGICAGIAIVIVALLVGNSRRRKRLEQERRP